MSAGEINAAEINAGEANEGPEPVQVDPVQAEKLRAAIRFEKGNPSDTDVAATVAVLAALTGSAAQPTTTGLRTLWGDSRERLRPQYFNGPNAYTSQTPLFWTKGT